LRSFQARQPRRCLESGSLLPPLAALRRFPTVAALRFAVLSGPPTAPLPRKRLASSAAGGASPLFHRCGNAVSGPFRSANRAAASKAARFFRRWRRFAAFPPLRQCGLRSFQARQPRRCLESGSLLSPQAALRRFSTVAAMRFAVLSGPPTAPLPRKRLASSAAGGASPLFHRCGNAVCGPFRPANRAAASKAARFFRRFSTVAAMRFAVLSGPPTAPLPRKRLASSAAGGASPLSPTAF